MEVKDILTLIIAAWGAGLATFQWVFRYWEKRNPLKTFIHWDNGQFKATIQNIAERPILIRECQIRARFLNSLFRRLFRIKDLITSYQYPNFLLQPGASYSLNMDSFWDFRDAYERKRIEIKSEKKHMPGGIFQIRFATLIIHDDRGHEYTSMAYNILENPAPLVMENLEEQGFVAPFTIPDSPEPKRISWLAGLFAPKNTSDDS